MADADVPNLEALRRLVTEAARAELIPRFQQVEASRKDDGSVITEADLAMQHRLRDTLARHWPGIAFLGEEMSDQEQLELLEHSERGLWCLDPLDGTSNFAMGIPFFCVSLALIQQGQPQLGVVYDPLRDECFMAQRGAGAWLNDRPLQLRAPHLPLARVIATVDFKRLPQELRKTLATAAPYSSQRNFGSSALEWCWLAAERYRVYLHGGQKLWDYAAGCLILAEAGGSSATLQGDPVFKVSAAPRSVVAALDSELFIEWQEWLHAHTGSR